MTEKAVGWGDPSRAKPPHMRIGGQTVCTTGRAGDAGPEAERGGGDGTAVGKEVAALEAVAEEVAKKSGVLVCLAQHSPLAPVSRPSLKLAVTLSASEDELVRAAQALVAAAKRVL